MVELNKKRVNNKLIPKDLHLECFAKTTSSSGRKRDTWQDNSPATFITRIITDDEMCVFMIRTPKLSNNLAKGASKNEPKPKKNNFFQFYKEMSIVVKE